VAHAHSDGLIKRDQALVRWHGPRAISRIASRHYCLSTIPFTVPRIRKLPRIAVALERSST
jgi:hypothetical protein